MAGIGAGEEEEEKVAAPAGYYDEAVAAAATRTISSATGAPASGSKNADAPEDSTRASARDILLSLPGINVHNFRDVMNNVGNLAELSAMSEVQLAPLVRPINAKKLFLFFAQNS